MTSRASALVLKSYWILETKRQSMVGVHTLHLFSHFPLVQNPDVSRSPSHRSSSSLLMPNRQISPSKPSSRPMPMPRRGPCDGRASHKGGHANWIKLTLTLTVFAGIELTTPSIKPLDTEPDQPRASEVRRPEVTLVCSSWPIHCNWWIVSADWQDISGWTQ